jgi:peptidyl-prolyl cis-trans isomerase SurA
LFDDFMLKRAIPHIASVIFLLAFFVSPYPSPAAVVEQLITVIDGEPYTLSNLATFAKTKIGRNFPSGDLDHIDASDREVLEQFITDKLLEAETRDAGIKVTDADVDQYIEQVKSNNRLSEEDFKTVLSREGQTLVSYKFSVKTELEKTELINRQVKSKVNITNEDVERYYKLNSQNYRTGDRARIRHILLSLAENAPPDAVQAANAKAKELYQRIKAGEDFATLAQEYSDGAGRADGGDIGWVKRGSLIGGLEEVAFQKLSVGQVSEPFRTTMGLHIVKLEARENGTVLPLAAVAPKIKEELYAKAMEERFNKWMKTDLRRKHRVDVKIAGVVFKPEESKEGTVDSLMAKSTRTSAARREDKSFFSYLNPMTYISKEIPFEEDDPKSPLYGKSIVTLFGMPMFTKERGDDVPDIINAPLPTASAPTASAPAPAASAPSQSSSGGFFDSLNPFSSKKP